jgi:hypothetical protein
VVGKLIEKEVGLLCFPESKCLKYAEASVTEEILLYIHVSVGLGNFLPVLLVCSVMMLNIS